MTDKVSVTATVTQPVVEAPQVAEPTAEPVKAVVQAQASSPIEVAKAELPAEQIAAAIPETRAAPLRAPQAAPQATPKEPAKRVTQVTTVEPATPQPRVRPEPKKQSALKPVTPAATIPDENYTQRLERLVIALSMDLGAMDDSADAFNSTTEAELALLRRRLITLSLENLQLREQLSETMPA